MAKFFIILALLSVNFVSAAYIPRAAPGTQLITGPCDIDADCASGCCGRNSGKCAGAIVALTSDGGCGHGDPQSNCSEGEIEARAPLSPDPAGVPNVENGQGKQFITGQCFSSDDCASGCCATLGNIGICSEPLAADQQGKTGCGFNSGAGGATPIDSTTPTSSPSGSAISGNIDISVTSATSAPCSDSECGKGEAAPN